VEDESEEYFHGFSTIYFPEIAESLILLVNPEEGEEHSDEMTCSGLIILRKIIEFENQQEDIKEQHKPCYEWESDEWELYKSSVIKRQDELCELNLVEVLGSVISSDKSKELKIEAINLCIALVLGGNLKAQEKFYDYF
jgi:hypothetical protein